MDVYGFISRLLALGVLVAAVLLTVGQGEMAEGPAVQEEELAVPAAAFGGRGDFANILIASEGGVSLERAYLLVNGEIRGNFASGSLQIRVYDGDILAVDCRAYGRELCFTVDILSASVDESYLPRQIRCRQQTAVLGFVVMR